ncbi:MAG TPA: hypothetical protein ENI23_06455 [bacterium]|nr:hypothetical protein [bacterium]
MADFNTKFTGRIDRRSPPSEGKLTDPIMRENWLARDGTLRKPRGTEKVFTSAMTDISRWTARYYSDDLANIKPKTLVYTKDGKMWRVEEKTKSRTLRQESFNPNAYPNSQLFKLSDQVILYFVDGQFLYKHDGNDDDMFQKVALLDNTGSSVLPIDVIEHKDRLMVISKRALFVSKNLAPDIFNDPNDSIELVVGSGRGENLAVGKLEDKLYILNTEGIFVLSGDVISALAATFEVRLIEDRNIISGRTAIRVEKAILFIAEDLELWSFDGISSQMLSFDFKLKDFMESVRDKLDKAVAIYQNNYYQLSFVEKGETEPNLEIWWDAFEDKIDVVRGRNVSCYLDIDQSKETEFLQFGRSDVNFIMWADRGYNFDGTAIRIRLLTRDIVVKKGENVRFTAFYPEIKPTGNRNIIIAYLLDGRLSSPVLGVEFSQNLRGETKTVGMIEVGNQRQFTGRALPQIKYARGESIAFWINDATVDLRADFIGMGIDFSRKHKSKGIAIGV